VSGRLPLYEPQDRVTIKTIAEAVGVTHGTVSRALRGDTRVKPETAVAIQQAALRLGYRPSKLGRALKTQRTGALAIVVSYISDPFYSEVIQAVHDRLFPLEHSLFMVATEHDPVRQRAAAQSLSNSLVDGVFVCCLPGLTPPFQELGRSVPLVTINCDPAKYPYDVVHDDASAVRECLDHLLQLGHRKIGYLGASTGGYAQRVRLQAFTSYGQELALRVTVGTAEDVKVETGEAAMAAWLPEWGVDRPTALICFNDTVAIGACKALREAGLSVPEDISVIGFDDIEMARYTQPALTTFAQPRYQIGRAAAEMMLTLLSGGLPEAPLLLRGELRIRQSSGPAI
jgi:DNA-binding LacI/PurR family transcriptional regulator